LLPFSIAQMIQGTVVNDGTKNFQCSIYIDGTKSEQLLKKTEVSALIYLQKYREYYFSERRL
jgi:hypothetical protein